MGQNMTGRPHNAGYEEQTGNGRAGFKSCRQQPRCKPWFSWCNGGHKDWVHWRGGICLLLALPPSSSSCARHPLPPLLAAGRTRIESWVRATLYHSGTHPLSACVPVGFASSLFNQGLYDPVAIFDINRKLGQPFFRKEVFLHRSDGTGHRPAQST